MTSFLIGIALFFGVHFVSVFRPTREALVARFGRMPYRAVFAALSAAGLGLIIYGYSDAGRQQIWTPFPAAREFAFHLMPVAFFLIIAADFKTRTRHLLVHPFSLGVLLWAAVHLCVTGHLSAVILFGAFAVLVSASAFGAISRKDPPREDGSLKYDMLAVAIAVLAYGGMLIFHEHLIGVPLI